MRSKLIPLFIALTSPQLMASIPDARSTPINAALSTGDWSTAEDLADDLVDDYPDESEAHYLLAQAIRIKMQSVSQMRAMMNLGDYTEALDEAIRLDPSHIGARTEQIGFLINAPGIAGGDLDLARIRITELARLDPLEAMRMQVPLAVADENDAEMVSVLEQLVKQDSDNLSHWVRLSEHYIGQSQFPSAEALMLELQAQPVELHQQFARYQRAKWRIMAGQDSESAIELLNAYLQTLPEDSAASAASPIPDRYAALWRLGLALELSGKLPEAISAMRQSLELNPDFENAEDDLKRLQKLAHNKS